MFDQNTFKETILESVKSLVDANVITGQPIVSGNITIIPVFKASIGIVSGGGSLARSGDGEAAASPLGGAGGGVTVCPVTFIVIDNGAVKILSAGDTSMVERLIDTAPGLIDKLAGLLELKEEDKPSE
jgi:sporulation protein YtfJ